MSQKIVTIGGLHGNEPLGVQLVQKIKNLNSLNFQAEYGNIEAIKQNTRFVDQDLNRVFPGNVTGNIEERRAAQLMNICQNFDFVLDFHNTHCSNNDCGFVGGNNWQQSVNLAGFLGLNKVIVADYDCINKYVQGCLSVEISLSSTQNNADLWVEKITSLSQFEPEKQYQQVQLYRFVYRVSREQQNTFQFKNWQAFEKISIEDVKKLQLDTSVNYYPIFVDDAYTAAYNFAGLITELYILR